MAVSEAETATAPPDPPLNYMDVKLHDVHNIPPNWFSDAKPPAYVEHPFRYEVSFNIDSDVPYTFTHGRLLQLLPQYVDYISSATPPPLASAAPSAVTDLRPLRDVPDAVDAPSSDERSGGGAGAQASSADDGAAAVDARIFWVTTPAGDAPVADAEPPARGRRPKRAAGGGGAGGRDNDEAAAAPQPLPQDDEAPPCVVRVPLAARQLAALEAMVIAGRPLEMHFARVLRPGLPAEWDDVNERQYRAVVAVDLSPLGEPGALSLTATVPLQHVRDATLTEAERTGKKRAVKRTKAGTPGLLVEEVNVEGPHPYAAHGTAATVSLRFEKTLVRLATERVRPALKPCNLIPTRAPPRAEYQDSTQQFGAAVKAIAVSIARAYAKEQGRRNKTGGRAGKELGESEREKLFETFQMQGRLAAYKEQLTPLVVKVVREKFISETGASHGAIAQVTNELYVYLLDCIHATLRNMTDEDDDSYTDYQNDVYDYDAVGSHGESGSSAPPSKATLNSESSIGEELGREGSVHKACAWAAPESPRPVDVVWLERAQEAETLRDYDAAARAHQARVASCTAADTFPNLWNDAAEFFVRVADSARAEQCYREGIACDPAHIPCLIGYGALLLASERIDEAAVYLHAAADLAPGVLPWGYLALLCDLRVLALEQGPRYEVTRAHIERDRGLVMEEARAGSGGDLSVEALTRAVAAHLLQLCHADLANVCLVRCAPGPSTELLYARLFEQCKKYEDALKALESAGADPQLADDVEILRADCYAALGRNEEAVRAYKSVLCRTNTKKDNNKNKNISKDNDNDNDNDKDKDKDKNNDDNCGDDNNKCDDDNNKCGDENKNCGDDKNKNTSDDPYAAAAQARFGRWYVHLGNLLITAGRYGDALGVFTIGIQAWPCSLMWLGAGIAYYRLGKFDAAEECLSESNTLNKTNPRTWGYLALVCLRKERAELELVLQQAVTQGLTDAALFAELGRDLVRANRVKMGEACLRKALALEQEAGRATTAVSCTTMYHLANALECGKRFDEAKEMYAAVVEHSQNEVLRAKAEEQLLTLAN